MLEKSSATAWRERETLHKLHLVIDCHAHWAHFFPTAMSTQSQKCKHTEDMLVKQTKMQLVWQQLSDLQEELSSMEATHIEMKEIMKHVKALEKILGSVKKCVSWIYTVFSVSYITYLPENSLFFWYNNQISQIQDWSQSLSGSAMLYWRLALQLQVSTQNT